MKVSIILLSVLFIFTSNTIAQSKKELQEQITKLNSEQKSLKEEFEFLKKQVAELQNEVERVKKENDQLRAGFNKSAINTNLNSSMDQCQAQTSKGTQCSRKAEPSSNYCWQHKSTYEPTKSSSSSSTSTSSGSYSSGSNEIHTGPRGGKYYINSKGKKTYVKKK